MKQRRNDYNNRSYRQHRHLQLVFVVCVLVLALSTVTVLQAFTATSTTTACPYIRQHYSFNSRSMQLFGSETTETETDRANKKLSKRASRKQREREKKKLLNERKKPVKRAVYELHSTAVSQLDANSSAADVIRAIKRAQNLHDGEDLRNIGDFLIKEVDVSYAFGYRGSLLSRLAVAALHMNLNDVAADALEVRLRQHRDTILPLESSAIARGLMRVGNITDALQVVEEELKIPDRESVGNESYREIVKYRARTIASLASRECYEDKVDVALLAFNMLREIGSIVREENLTPEELKMPWKRIVQGAAQFEKHRREGTIIVPPERSLPSNLVYSVLAAMATFPSDNNDDLYETISNALVRRTQFIKGAVSMKDLPVSDRGEAVFIGRSNVGKSSLVNMVTNRKSLAFTSKTPGKTQQFNYFAVNDKPDLIKEIKYGDEVSGEKDLDSFYLVDLPGFGYAEVPDAQKQEWADFMSEYMVRRKNLNVVFHLIDSRHGPIDEDRKIMKQVGENLPSGVKYVIVLTKADKNTKKKKNQNVFVSENVMDRVRKCMKESGTTDAPVLLTSAESKQGRDAIWRYLQLAANKNVDKIVS